MVSAFAVEQGQSVGPKETSVRPKENRNKAKYVVALNKRRLTSNFGLALNRLTQQCGKFQKDTQYLEHYQKILKDHEDRGFIERVEYVKTEEDCHFLAHNGVKKDTATRIVFDCLVRQGKSGLSLNNCLWTGLHITADLLKVLLQLKQNHLPVLVTQRRHF
ncbi:uncharacterized protein [Macrobrachium rosenbergii]|uniref:uncharacterized protein n=1 Tax=Macrobrachium rosenbergii TaxID=79674 RepID=UPI0034D4EE6D